MQVEYIEETSVRKALAFEVEATVLDQEIDARAREHARKVRLPGFRPGKVPAAVIRQRYRGLVLEEAIETVVNRLVPPELEGRGLRPVATPRVTDLKHDEGAPFTFRVVFEILPIIELPEYRGLEVKAREAQVAEEAVDEELKRLLEEHARYDPVEGRAVEAGDFALVDLAWNDGQRDGREDNALIQMGGEETAPAIREALLGAAPGDTREADVERPAGDEAQPPRRIHYTLQVKAVKVKVLPALDDEFAKDVGSFETLAELRDDLRRRLRQAEERRIDREIKTALVDEIAKRASFELPEALVERHMTLRTEQAARALALQGVDPSKVGLDWKAYRESQRDEALRAAKADVLLDEIAQREGIEAAEADVEAELARYALATRKSKEAVRRQMEKDGDLAGLRARIREEKTLDLLRANARLAYE